MHIYRTPLIVGLLVASVGAAPVAEDLREPQFMSEADKGFTQIFSLDYSEAIVTFVRLREEYPEHPAPPFYVASAVWLEELFQRQDLDLNKFLSPGYFDEPTDHEMPADTRQRFFDLIEESRKKARQILDEQPGHKDARYFLGSCHGVLAAFAITVDHSKREAFNQGKKAYSYHHDLIEEDPSYYDSYMSTGIYEYVVGSLPWYIKWLAVIAGYRGTKEQGYEYLEKAAQKGQYVADEARVLQMVLFVREEEYDKALQRARFLHQKFPKNFLLHLNRAQILERKGETQKALETYKQVLSQAEQGAPNYTKIDQLVFRYTLGRKFMELDDLEAAVTQFRWLTENPRTAERERALSHLQLGKILKQLERFDEARHHCRQVLALKDFEDSHDEAEDILDDLPETREG